MRAISLLSTLLVCSAALAQSPGSSPAASQNSTAPPSGSTSAPGATGAVKAGASVTDPHQEKLLKQINKEATPDGHHKALQALVGKWDTRAKLWLGQPKPETASGHAEVTSILGGRFVEEHYDSIIWGQPFAAQGLVGFDLLANKFTIGWIDSWSTWITVAQGTGDVTSHVLTLSTRDYDDPAGKTRPVKFIISIDSNDHHTRRVYEKVNGKETMTMEIEYRRHK